jgi:iron complex outermembrane recepter protein
MLNQSLLSPSKNHNLYFQGGIDLPALGDTTEFYWEAMYNRRESSQVGYRQLALDYAVGSPLIPSNLQFSDALGPTSISNGNDVGVRAFIGTGNDHSSQSVNFTRAVAGLRGNFSKINWDYDVSLTHSESRGTYAFDGFRTDRLAQSLDVVADGNGGYTCVDPANGCVAAPALTSAVVGGRLPAAWLDYVFNPKIQGVTKYKEDVLTASTTGDIYALPYGKMKGAFGLEYRRNSIDDVPSDDMQNGNIYNFTSSTRTRGSDSAKDIFGEIEVPVLKGLPFAHELTLNGSLRRSDYRSYGAGTTHKFGGLYAPVKWLSVRGTMGTSYRAPALFEQYVGATTGFLSASVDPCNDYDQKTGNLATNCASEGLPAGFQQTNGVTDITSGGRGAGLKAETSKNNSWGIILQPDMPTGWGDLSFALDHYNINVSNGISQVGYSNILSLCYNDPNFRNSGSYCRLVTRDPTSHALTINDSYINVASNLVRGNDYTVSYSNNVGIGKLNVDLVATQYLMQGNKLFADDPWTDINGIIGSPKWSGEFDVSYKVKNWKLHWATEFVGRTNEYAYDAEDPATSNLKLTTPTYFLHSMSVTYEEPVSKWKATLGVRNLFDKKPPAISSGYDNRIGTAPLYSGYDLFGRTFFASMSKSF